MQCNAFDRHILKVAVGQICHSLGWNAVQQSSLEVLTDILERYITKLTKTTACVSQNSSHIDPDMIDLGLAFDELGIQVCELDDYVHQVDPIHLSKTVSQYPVSCQPHLKFPSLEEALAREEYYDEQLPPLDRIIKGETAEEQNEVNETIESKEESPPDATPLQLPSLNTIKSSNVESPPFSPVEPKTLNHGAQLLMPDLTRPDLNVVAPKDTEAQGKVPNQNQPIFTARTPPISQVETIRKTAEKRPAAAPEISRFKTDEQESTLSPVSSKRAKLSTATPSKNEKESDENDTRRTVKSPDEKIVDKLDMAGTKNDTKAPLGNLSDQNQYGKLLDERQKFSIAKPDPVIPQPKVSASFTTKSWSELREESIENVKEQNKFTPSAIKNETNSAKPEKLMKSEKKIKTKRTDSSKHDKKRQRIGSPQLFASPHLLKSPVEQHRPIAASPPQCNVSLQRLQVKSQKEPESLSSPKSSSSKVKDAESAPQMRFGNENSPALVSKHSPAQLKKEKKIKKKKTVDKKISKKDVEHDKPTAAYSIPEKSTRTPSLKHNLHTDDAKPSKFSKSSHFSVQQSQKNIFSPTAEVARTPSPEDTFKQDLLGLVKDKKHDAKKAKKDKKAKKKEKLESGVKSKEEKKSSTPSLKLTFKRSSAAASQQDSSPSSSTLKYHGVSSALSPPVETPPPKIASPPPQPKKKKSKKDKLSEIAPIPAAKEKKTYELGVRIEPLVINEPFKDSHTPEKKAGKKKNDSKPVHTGKRGRPPKHDHSPVKKESSTKIESHKKEDSGKKHSAKETESGKKGAYSKKAELVEPKTLVTPPSALSSSEEQSVSRGLFIQTITEAPTTQVWYCPSCLRPDDGSPMIGCDSCDGWYHWTCVGITEDPVGDAEWYCSACVEKMSKKKTKKRKKKD